MRILEYYMQELEELGWTFSKVQFKKMNLLVGDTASGKSRFLNTIFNLGAFVAQKKVITSTRWEITFEHKGYTYTWHLTTQAQGEISEEKLWRHDNLNKLLIQRTPKEFIFQEQVIAAKLSLHETSISLLKEEEAIRPLFEAFSSIQRRLFDTDILKVAAIIDTTIHSPLILNTMEQLQKQKDISILFEVPFNMNSRLFFLSKYFPNLYQKIIDQYKQIFPFIKDATIYEFIPTALQKLGADAPKTSGIHIFGIRENKTKWIPIDQLSSGMQKILLFLTDIAILPDDGIYIIDEYENSLGISAIEFLPQFITDTDKKAQFFITSHHPYIINNIPMDNWYIFHRKDMNVSMRYGEEIIKHYGKSKHQAFTNLINDPFYNRKME